MRNNLATLNNYMFECIERVMDPSLTDEERANEVATAQAVSGCAKTILETARLELDVLRFRNSDKHNIIDTETPDLLKLEDK